MRAAFVVLPPLLLALLAGRLLLAVEPSPEVRPDAPTAVSGTNIFACELYSKLSSKSGNIFFSPFSIHTALSMTSAGAGGKTLSEFTAVLHALPNEKAQLAAISALAHRYDGAKDYELAVANRLFGRVGESFQPAFLTLCQDTFGAPLEQVAFPEPGRTRINAWVEERTKTKIKDLIPVSGVDANTALVLVNAIYFKGTWATQFDPAVTKDGVFTISPDTTVTVPFMARSDHILLAKMGAATLVELPYVGGDLVMDLIVPNEKDGLNAVEQKLDMAVLQTSLAALLPTKVELSLPRFTLRWGTESLKAPLQALGLRSAFADADFSRLGNVNISDVFHQAFAAVDEQGTVAAAATAVATRKNGHGTPAVVVRADHPFLFLIRDCKTTAIIFMGRVVDPK